MKLYLTAQSERGKEVTKSGNDWINIELTVNRVKIGSVELYLNKDSEDGCDTDEWVLNWFKENSDDIDPFMISQGNISPKEIKRRTR